MTTFRSLLFALLLLAGLNLSAKEIYVSTKGDDHNPGSKEKPLASLGGAQNLMRQLRTNGSPKEDFRVIVADGTYFMAAPLVLNEQDSGTENFPVTFMAGEGANPVFNGGIPITKWEKVSEKLWKAKVPEVNRYGFYFEQLFVNGKFATRAKSPNTGFYFLKDVDETIIHKGTGRSPEMGVQKFKIFSQAANDVATFTKSDYEDAVLTLYHKWDNTRKRISDFNADSSVVYTVGQGMKPWNKPDKQTRFTIDNYKAALDTCGEWFLDRTGDLYYMPNKGENISTFKVFAPVLQQFIVLEGNPKTGTRVQNISFKNLKFEVSAYRMPMMGNEPAQAASPVEAVIQADFTKNITFANCEISQIGTNGFWFRKACSDCSVTQCYVHETGAGGVKIGDMAIPVNEIDLTRKITIDNNILRTGGFVFPCAVGVTLFQASDIKITHNEIANYRYSGVSVGWVWGYTYSPSKRNIVDFNHIHHLGWGELCDMGGVYCLGQSEGTSVSNNVIHHVYSFDYGGWGLYTDEGSTGIMLENNLVYACKNSGFHQHYGKENTIRNNIFAANIKAQLQATRVEEHLSFNFTNNIVWYNEGTLLSSRWREVKINSDYNCYWDTRTKDIHFDKLSFAEWQASGKDKKSVIADPQFKNPTTFDFQVGNKALMKKIGFKPFDYSKAGVYGSAEWIELAKFDPALAQQYDIAVKRAESIRK